MAVIDGGFADQNQVEVVNGALKTTAAAPVGGATEAKQDAAITQETATATVLGTTADAAVTTDVTATISARVRGAVNLWKSLISTRGAAIPAAALMTGVSDGINLNGALGAANALNSTGAGLAVAQAVAQFDDTSPQTVTENQFGNLRMSAKGVAYQTIRDAAGSERGVNVTAANALLADTSGGVQGFTANSTATITRPGDTNAYAAKDAISSSTSAPAILTFANCARASGGSGYITSARLVTNQAACVSAFRLHLYDATLSAVNDNAAQTVLETNWGSYIGYIDFPAMTSDGSDTASSQSTDKPLPFVAAGTSLFGMLETITGFTPANAQHFALKLGIEQN